MKPARPPSWVAVIPSGGRAGVTKPRMPSHHSRNGTMNRSMRISPIRIALTITQFASSSDRLIFFAAAVMRKTTTSSAIA